MYNRHVLLYLTCSATLWFVYQWMAFWNCASPTYDHYHIWTWGSCCNLSECVSAAVICENLTIWQKGLIR